MNDLQSSKECCHDPLDGRFTMRLEFDKRAGYIGIICSVCGHGLHAPVTAPCPPDETSEVSRLREALARWESPDNWGAFVELLGLPRDHVNKPLGVAAGIALLNSKLDRYMKALQTANGYLIMNNLEPVKPEYPSEKANVPRCTCDDFPRSNQSCMVHKPPQKTNKHCK